MKSEVQGPKSKVARAAVAQICNLLYRRFSTCRAQENSVAPLIASGLPIANREDGRLQICATRKASPDSLVSVVRLWTLGFRICSIFAAGCLVAADVEISKLPPPTARPIDFAADIKPIFEAACLRCHGTERPKSRFSLATRDAALRGGEIGIAIVPGDSAKSPLVHYVAGLVPDMEMPPAGKGDPLTREQISLLRAWIDQGVSWEQIDTRAQYTAQFSFTPAVRWVTIRGNARKFQEHQWVRQDFSQGVSDFRIAQKTSNGVSVVAAGHALTDDYKISLDVRKEDIGFARFGFEQLRHYYDDRGPYYQFRPRGFATQAQNIFDLDRDLHLDVGKAFAEFGLDRPGWPRVTVGYDYYYKNGSKSTEEWGPVSQQSTGGSNTRHIYPAYKDIDESVHVLRLDVSHELAGTRIEDNLRAEFVDLRTRRTANRVFPAGQISPSVWINTRESHDELVLANALRGERPVNDWLFLSAGYLFSRFDADAAVRLDNKTGAGLPAGGPYWYANNVTLSEHGHVFNLNALGGPWDGFTAALGVQNEWSEKTGLGTPNYRDGAATNLVNKPGWIGSVTERMLVEENLVLRYTKIPATVLFAEARLRQERSGLTEEQRGEHDIFHDADIAADRQEFKAGFDVSPVRWASFHASYKYRLSDNEYDDNIDARLPREMGESYAEFIRSGDGYPGFIRSRQTESDIFEARLALRPLSWLKATLSYQRALTDYHTRTDPVFVETNSTAPPVLRTGVGRILAGEYDLSTYGANVTITPWRRWFFSGAVSYQQSRTWTADQAGALVVPYRGDTYSALASSTFVLSQRTDLLASYAFSRARFAQHNAASGLPLGFDYDSHGLQFGVTHRFHTNLTASVQYGFFDYSEPTARGFNDYTAHMLFAMLSVRLP